tara:strand:- start:381 stop:887 length:507 start_codon:yes stop_codon:yes gene_type:complete
MKRSVHFMSKRSDWATPQDFFDLLNAEFNFDLDVCASKSNAKCSNYYTIADDALQKPWKGYCFMNPPYGREISKWVKKAYESSGANKVSPFQGEATVVCLLPSRTDTKWWHDYVMKADTVRFVQGRLKFDSHSNSAPFPSVVVVFGNYPKYKSGFYSLQQKKCRALKV